VSAPDETTSHFGFGTAREDELPRGTEIAGGRFTILALRGAGGMAMVYLARDRDRGLDVAFKLIGAKYAGKPGAEQRLRNEGMFAERIGAHPNVARPLEYGRLEDGRTYLVTEFVRGPSLADLLAMERRLSTTRACRIARDIAAGLVAIHSSGVVHRDVKPDNVIIAHDGDHDVAKLVDFGLAGEIEPVGERLTAVHERPGTRLYMAPEQLAGGRNAPGFDVYALGVTMYEMLCGFAPNESRAAADMIARKLEPATSVAEHRPDLPAALVSLVDRCMHPDPGKRVGSAAEVLAGLDEVLAELGFASDPGPAAGMFVPRVASRVSATGEATAEVARGSSKVWMWIAAGVAVVALVGIGRMQGWWLSTRADEVPVAKTEPVPEKKTDEVVVAAPVGPAPVVAEPVAAPAKVPPTADPVAPDPVPVAEPVAEPAVDPTGEDPKVDPTVTPRKPKVKPEVPAVPKTPEHETPECAATRDSADKAAKAKDWRGVLSHAKSRRECWADRNVWLRRVLFAHSNLAEWAKCVDAGKSSKDPQIAALVQTCREKLGEP
jgi:hypothetical protein